MRPISQRPHVFGELRRLMQRELNNTIVHWPRDNPGGHHFIAMNEPAAHVADLRTFFDKVR